MTIFVLFFVELMAMRFAIFDPHGHEDFNLSHSHSHDSLGTVAVAGSTRHDGKRLASPPSRRGSVNPHTPGEDHLSHSREHVGTEAGTGLDGQNNGHGHSHGHKSIVEDYTAQMTAIFILEFGVIFHSIFVGLTLAVSGEEFRTLYVVLVFHQTFEGLGLGSRLAITPWPENRRWTPYILGAAYGLSTPIAIAIGLGLRTTYEPGTQTALIVNGVFDSISAGILIYTGLVELMAHEFMFSEYMRHAKMSVVLAAYGIMCLGAGKLHPIFFLSLLRSLRGCSNRQCAAIVQEVTNRWTGLMALLGKWA